MKKYPVQTKGFRISEYENATVFHERMKNFGNESIECTNHTFFRLSEKQKKEFTCDTLKSFLLNEFPLKAGIQVNGNYAIYYKYAENRVLKIVMAFYPTMARIVTFKILDKSQLPR